MDATGSEKTSFQRKQGRGYSIRTLIIVAVVAFFAGKIYDPVESGISANLRKKSLIDAGSDLHSQWRECGQSYRSAQEKVTDYNPHVTLYVVDTRKFEAAAPKVKTDFDAAYKQLKQAQDSYIAAADLYRMRDHEFKLAHSELELARAEETQTPALKAATKKSNVAEGRWRLAGRATAPVADKYLSEYLGYCDLLEQKSKEFRG